MKREYHRWHSSRLGIELGVVVYGHWGPPLMGFPTSAGDEWELENQGMIGALGEFIEAGRIKFFSVNSVNHQGLYNRGAHPFHRSYMQAMFDGYLREEVVPFVCGDFHHGRVFRRLSRGKYFIQASGRVQTVFRDVRRVRCQKFHGWHVR